MTSRAGVARRGGADDVVQGALARLARALQEEPHQVPALVPTRLLRQARTAPAIQEQLERSPGNDNCKCKVQQHIGMSACWLIDVLDFLLADRWLIGSLVERCARFADWSVPLILLIVLMYLV